MDVLIMMKPSLDQNCIGARCFWLLLWITLAISSPVRGAVSPADAAAQVSRVEATEGAAVNPTRQLVVDVADVMSVVLEEGDVLRIVVLNDPVLSMDQALINKGGAIIHSVLKELKVAGLTLKEAQEMIYEMLARDYLVDPMVTLSIVKYASYEFSVLDEVNRPGTFSLPRDKKIDIAQAVAMAGGPTRVGSPKVVVERMENGKVKLLKVDTSKPNNIIVQPDDKIKVGEKFW
jgi:polysaccharide export outer membrane protein